MDPLPTNGTYLFLQSFSAMEKLVGGRRWDGGVERVG